MVRVTGEGAGWALLPTDLTLLPRGTATALFAAASPPVYLPAAAASSDAAAPAEEGTQDTAQQRTLSLFESAVLQSTELPADQPQSQQAGSQTAAADVIMCTGGLVWSTAFCPQAATHTPRTSSPFDDEHAQQQPQQTQPQPQQRGRKRKADAQQTQQEAAAAPQDTQPAAGDTHASLFPPETADDEVRVVEAQECSLMHAHKSDLALPTLCASPISHCRMCSISLLRSWQWPFTPQACLARAKGQCWRDVVLCR